MNSAAGKTILVAGGAGYIGSHTVVELLGAGYRLDRDFEKLVYLLFLSQHRSKVWAIVVLILVDCFYEGVVTYMFFWLFVQLMSFTLASIKMKA